MSDDDARALTAYLSSLKGQAAKTKAAAKVNTQQEVGR